MGTAKVKIRDFKAGDPVTVQWVDATKCEGAEFRTFEEMPNPIESYTTGYFVGMDDDKVAVSMTIHCEDAKSGGAVTYRDVLIITRRQMIWIGAPVRPLLAIAK